MPTTSYVAKTTQWTSPYTGGTFGLNNASGGFSWATQPTYHIEPAGGWEVGARPPQVEITFVTTLDIVLEVEVYDTAAARISESDAGSSTGVGTLVTTRTLTFGSHDIDYILVSFPYNGATTTDIAVTDILVADPPPVEYWTDKIGCVEVET
jgi:hypothetical protein